METTTQSNKTLYREFIEQVFNLGKVEKVNDYLAPNYQLHDSPPGSADARQGVVGIVQMFRGAFPDLKITIEEQIAEGDWVASRTTTRGTHRGPLFGVPPSNRSIAVPGLTMVRIVNGRITESSVKNDVVSLLKQIGATTLP